MGQGNLAHRVFDLLHMKGADPHQATRWTYSYTPQTEGRYQLRVRSVSQDGRTSPVEATVDFAAYL